MGHFKSIPQVLDMNHHPGSWIEIAVVDHGQFGIHDRAARQPSPDGMINHFRIKSCFGGKVDGFGNRSDVYRDNNLLASLATLPLPTDVCHGTAHSLQDFLDSVKAIDGTLAIMVGGAKDDFDRVKEILQAMGSTVTYIGSIGSGNVAKLANQIIVAINIAAVSEAISFASKAGLDPEVVYHAIRGGLAGSTVMDAKLPMMYNRDFNPGARMMVHIKDLRNALEMAHEISAALPLSSQILEYMYSLKAEGKENIDHGVLVQFYEKISHVIVQKKTET